MKNNNQTSNNNKNLPNHVAIIMDGNGRWATKKLLPRISGHKKAITAVRAAIEFCVETKIPFLTLFAFGIDNWQRPKIEVNTLMSLFSSTLTKELNTLMENDVVFTVIGDKKSLSLKMQAEISDIEEKTKNNTGLRLNVAISYSGKWDIVEACKKIATKVRACEIEVEDINETVVNNHILLSDQPAPDLFIRTSGEYRISNFLLWQLAYTELYFTDTCWPDFTKEDFTRALEFYANRKRRFGLTQEQIELGINKTDMD